MNSWKNEQDNTLHISFSIEIGKEEACFNKIKMYRFIWYKMKSVSSLLEIYCEVETFYKNNHD